MHCTPLRRPASNIAAGCRGTGGPARLPPPRVPAAFAAARATVHVPRAPYARALPGIPTIRMFEAMACGIPIVSAPWQDIEQLFPPGCYVRVVEGAGMKAALRSLLRDRELSNEITRNGLR